MERAKLQVSLREAVGKGGAKKIREAGGIPGILYGRDINIPIEIFPVGIKILRSIHFSESSILDMEVVNGKKKSSLAVIIKDLQYHPLTEEIIHIDFMKVSLEEKIKVPVPLFFKGEAKGVKEGGVFEVVCRDMEIEGFPLDIPEKIEVDISSLKIGESLHVKNIKIADNLKIITYQEDTIATVVAKKEEEEEAPPAEEAEPQEPEVIKEKKKAEGEEEKKGKKEKE